MVPFPPLQNQPLDYPPDSFTLHPLPLSLRNVEDLLHEQGIEISHETVQYWWNRFGPMLAAVIRGRRAGPAPPLSPSGAAFSRPDRQAGRGNGDWFAFV